MPLMNGFEATQKALAILPNLKIIGFTVFPETQYYDKMMKIGAKGFVLKSSGFNELENAIKTVMNGEVYFVKKYRSVMNSEINRNETSVDSENENQKSEKNRKLLFFPWVVNRKNFVTF